MKKEEKKDDKLKVGEGKIKNTVEVEPELDEALDRVQRRKRAMMMKRIQPKIKAGRRRAKRKRADAGKLQKRANKQAKNLVRGKLSGQKNYKDMSPEQKIQIDKRVEKKAAVVQRLAKRLLPKVRKAEMTKKMTEDYDALFEGFIKKIDLEPNASNGYDAMYQNHMAADGDCVGTKKRFHQMFKKDGAILIDRRFKAFNKKNDDLKEGIVYDFRPELKRRTRILIKLVGGNYLKGKIKKRRGDVIYAKIFQDYQHLTKLYRMDLKNLKKSNVEYVEKRDPGDKIPDKKGSVSYNRVNEALDTVFSDDFENLIESINEKADKSGYDVDTIKTVFNRGIDEWVNGTYDIKPNEYAMNRVNSFISEGKAFQMDSDLLDESAKDRMIAHAVKKLHDTFISDKDKKRDLGSHAFDVSKMYSGLKPRELMKYFKKEYPSLVKAGMYEEKKTDEDCDCGGAGEEGTDKLVKKYKKDTPMESFRSYVNNEYLTEAECEYFTMKQMREFEKFVDKIFAKYDIDFDFTKHFADRLGDDRNKPCIKAKELAQMIQKIYKNQGKNLKKEKDSEAVVKDMQTDLNMPVAIEYNQRKDEFRVAAKTIMRKKNFHTPDKIIRYK